MNTHSQDIIAKLHALKPVLQEEMGIKRLRVFGSVARGEARQDSDVDLLVDFDETPSLLKMAGYKLQLEDHLGKKVDFITEAALHDALRDIVMKDVQDV